MTHDVNVIDMNVIQKKTFKEYFEERYYIEYNEQVDKVKEYLQREDKTLISKRIRNFLNLYKSTIHYTEEHILNLLLEGSNIETINILLTLLATDPKKCNFAERTQKSYLSLYKNIDIELLQTRNGIYLHKGEFTREKKSRSKSFDAKQKNNYFFMKYTKEGGGGQTNQESDVCLMLKEVVTYIKKNNNRTKFIFLLDGDFYTPERLDDLRKKNTYKRIIITNSDEIKI